MLGLRAARRRRVRSHATGPRCGGGAGARPVGLALVSAVSVDARRSTGPRTGAASRPAGLSELGGVCARASRMEASRRARPSSLDLASAFSISCKTLTAIEMCARHAAMKRAAVGYTPRASSAAPFSRHWVGAHAHAVMLMHMVLKPKRLYSSRRRVRSEWEPVAAAIGREASRDLQPHSRDTSSAPPLSSLESSRIAAMRAALRTRQ